ncbi:putative prgn [Enterococcus mundtii 1A]|uniref:type III secretion system protein PrgN n=1 Tax=Enterococcus mundtii TaxID=53346 RepID=UPI002303BD76|nr:type III secretion system protein PrgN [Enterococcus mundtii]MDA9428870.1 putative prgn [Enterococcus mundtii 1A]MEC3942708.1 type III secretion system protein PrgN [Enterococcus mundtii]
MSRNTFVYSHPINVFIIKYLGVTVDQFCESYGYSQGTVASWITRNRRVESLPVGFIYDLGLAASLNMSDLYDKLLLLQEDYDAYLISKGKKKKKHIE